jgi:SAM-dependent methyltransferase
VTEPAVASPRTEYDPDLFAELQAAQDRHFWFRHRNSVIAAAVRGLRAGWSPESRVLEVGCGTGNTLRVLETACRPAQVIGLDYYEEGLALARQNVGCKLVQGDIRSIPLTGLFELICAFDVIEHLADDVDVLASLRSRLTLGSGRLMITVPAHMALWSYFDDAAHHCRRYSAHGLRAALENAGLEVEYLTYFMLPLYPLVWLGRRAAAFRAKIRPTSNQQLARKEFRVVPVLNGLLLGLLALECPFIRSRRRLPTGTSLLAVARSTASI